MLGHFTCTCLYECVGSSQSLLFISLFPHNQCEVFVSYIAKYFLLLLKEATGPWIPAGGALGVLVVNVVLFIFL